MGFGDQRGSLKPFRRTVIKANGCPPGTESHADPLLDLCGKEIHVAKVRKERKGIARGGSRGGCGEPVSGRAPPRPLTARNGRSRVSTIGRHKPNRFGGYGLKRPAENEM
jgi:hypothetical protein